MKFKKPIEVQAGISDGDPTNPLGQSGYLLSSDGSNVNWVSPGGLSAETAESIVQPIKADEALSKGDPVYIVGFQSGQNVNIVAKSDASDPSKMPATGVADDDYNANSFGTMTAFGSFNGNFDTTGGAENWQVGDVLYVAEGGGLTNVKPEGATLVSPSDPDNPLQPLIQNIAIVSRRQQNTGELEVIALGRTNDVPNLPEGRLFVGTAANTSLTSDVVYVDDANERVGIRTTGTPSTNLEVSSSSNLNGIDISKTTNTSQSGALFFTTNTPSEGFLFRNSNGTFQINSGGIPNNSSGTNRISIIGSSGNVGIGETVPQEKLHVSDGGNVRLEVESTSSFTAALKLTNTAGSYASYVDLSGSLNTFDYIANSVRTTLLSNGNFGIGTTNPTEKLEVEDSGTLGVNKDVLSITNKLLSAPSVDTTVGMNFNLQQGSNSAITYGAIQVGEHAGTGYIKGSMRFLVQDFSGGFNLDEKMRIESNGNVGIGTDSPSELLHISSLGPARLLIEADTDNVTETDNAQIILKQDGGAVVGNLGFKTGTNTVEVRNEYTGVDGHLSLSTSNTERLHIKYNGNVGIGTTSPEAKLHVSNGLLRTWAPTSGTSAIFESTVSNRNFVTLTAANEAELWFGNAATQTKGRVRYEMANNNMEFWTNGTQKMVINGSGNVGIGTTSLTSISSTSRTLSLGSTSTTTSGGIAFQANSVVKAYNYVANNYLINQTVAGIGQIFYGAGSEQMRIHNTTGNVGIGTIAPNAKLEVAGYTRITGGGLDVGYDNNGTNFVQVGWGRTTNGYAFIDLIGDDFYDDYGFRIIRNNSGQNTDTDILHRGLGDLDLKTIDAGDIGFHTTSVQRMIVKSSGNVGIGDSNPDAKLEIAGHSTSGKFLLIDSVASGDTFLDVEDGLGSTLLSITRETGNTIKFNSFNDFSFADNISVTGTVTATNFILSSDENLKDNIKKIDVKHTDVNWKNFELKSEPGIKRAGVIAQELEVKHPEFVRTASDGIKSVAYIDLLITKIAELEARLEKLEK